MERDWDALLAIGKEAASAVNKENSTPEKFCLEKKPDLLCVSEPMVALSHIPESFFRSIRLKPIIINIINDRSPRIPNIWILCSESFNVSVLSSSSQQISVKFAAVDNTIGYATMVYASTRYAQRRSLQAELVSLKASISGPWIVMGD